MTHPMTQSTAGPGRARWSTFPALALLVLLAGWGPVVDAAYDPTVEAVQEALTGRGFEPGAIDGAMGSRTRKALREFQNSVGLPPTGEIDAATRAALGLDPPPPGSTPAPATSTPAPATSAPAPATSAPAPATSAPASATSALAHTAESGTAPDADTDPAEIEPAPAAPAPKPAPKPSLRFATLGWHPPGSGAEALERFIAIGAPRDFGGESGSLFVPKADLVFVLRAGERIPGFDCDPGAGRLAVELVFGPDGPIIFTPAAGAELCRMGIGIALEVGRTLEVRPVDWGDVRYPQGTVRVTREGLRYID